MAAFADTFQNWKDFPKGLSVLVVDTDEKFLEETRCKLESYDYIVTSFSSGQGACAALANKEHVYHVALVEATDDNDVDSSKVLEFSGRIPMIMISGTENMSIMVKSIALGAVEFLLKPLSEEKLKNIWQHVVRKAIDSKDVLQSGYLEPGRKDLVSGVHDDYNHIGDSEENNVSSAEKTCADDEFLSIKVSVSSERLPAPTTPQLEQCERQEAALDESLRFRDSIDAQEPNGSDEKLSISGISKSDSKELQPSIPDISSWNKQKDFSNQMIEVTCCTTPTLETAMHSKDAEDTETSFNYLSAPENQNSSMERDASKDDERSMSEVNKDEMLENQSMGESTIVQSDLSRRNVECLNTDSMSSSQSFEHQNQNNNVKRKPTGSDQTGKEIRSKNKKKPKVDWTAELHQQFVQAIEYLGVEQAIPSKILEVMKVDGLTRHNIASHLQKYRSQKKHHYGKEVGINNWHHNRIHNGKTLNRVGQAPTWIQPRPPLIFPPLHVWGHPAVENSSVHVMPQYAHSNTWPNFDNMLLKHSMAPGIPYTAACYLPHMLVGAHQENPHVFSTSVDSVEATNQYENSKSLNSHQSKELLDAAIREALSNPWTPLPLGLKPPSMESVMTELQRQGIDTVTLYMN